MACGGEWLDMTAEISKAAVQPDSAHWHDIWNTLFWPTVLLAVGRWLQPKERGASAAVRESASGEDAERRLEQAKPIGRSEEHTSELQSLMRISYAAFCLTNKRHAEHQNDARYIQIRASAD